MTKVSPCHELPSPLYRVNIGALIKELERDLVISETGADRWEIFSPILFFHPTQ